MIKKNIQVRAYTHHQKEQKEYTYTPERVEIQPLGDRVLVFDTETKTDIYQNLTFGSCCIYQFMQGGNISNVLSHNIEELLNPNIYKDDYILEKEIIFYADGIQKKNLKILTDYCDSNKITLISQTKFINEIFLKEVWEKQTLCVGFNLPFDISRIAIDVQTHQKGRYKDSFELILKDNLFTPNIAIQNIDSKKAFISLTKPAKTFGRKPYFNGNFLDLRTLVFALTNESCSLNKACDLFGVGESKHEVEEHGIITPEYIAYNRQDVKLTWELFKKAKAEFEKHPIDLPITKVFSPASIGKAYFKKMNIISLFEKQPDFDLLILGKAMSSYYGGRAECHMRKIPTKILYTDVTSMYPTVFTLQNLWSWVIADKLEVEENTEFIKKLLDDITLDKLFDKNIWTSIPALVEIVPDNDILPIRTNYSDGNASQIGVNYLTCNQTMCYTFADVIVSKLLTGKCPKIIKAYTVKVGNPQNDLKSVKLKGEIPVNPVDCNFFKTVIEKRSEVKRQMKKNTPEKIKLDGLQMFLKILANSTSYGIFIELVSKTLDKEQLIDVYGVDDGFQMATKTIEENGHFCNPLLATMITGASRLILGMIECLTHKNSLEYVFCDTDSMGIAVQNHNDMEKALNIVNRFESLNPYDRSFIDGSILKIEDENYKDSKLEDLYCYMISSKRYVLYNIIDGEIKIRKKSDHGLGHLKPPVENAVNWINDIWLYILNKVYKKTDSIKPTWWNTYAMGQYTLSKPNVYKLFDKVNKNKDYKKKIKPYNFCSVWYTDKLFSDCTIISPYVKPEDFNKISDSLIDRTNGEAIDLFDLSDGNGNYSIKTYGEIIEAYMYHPESKFSTNKNEQCTKDYCGLLQRSAINADKIIQIGKEITELDDSMIFGVDENAQSSYINKSWDKIKGKVNSDIQLLNNGITKQDIEHFLNTDSPNKNIAPFFNKVINTEFSSIQNNYTQIDTIGFNKYCYVPYWNNKQFNIRLLVEINGDWHFIKSENYNYLIKNHLIQKMNVIDVLKNCDFHDNVFATEIINYPEYITFENCRAIWHLKTEELQELIKSNLFYKNEIKRKLISRAGIFRVMQNYTPPKEDIDLNKIKVIAKKGFAEFEFNISDIDGFICRKRIGNSNKAEVLIKVHNNYYYVPIQENLLMFKYRILPRPKNTNMSIRQNGYITSGLINYPDSISFSEISIKWNIPKNELNSAIKGSILTIDNDKIDRLGLVKYILSR